MQPMITRTVRGSDVQLLCMNQSTGKLFKQHMFIPGRYNSTDSRKLRLTIDALHRLPDNVKIIKILTVEKVSRRFRMFESTFIQHAEQVTTESAEKTEKTENQENNERV